MKEEINNEIEYFSRRYHYNTTAGLKPQIVELLKRPECIIMVEAMKDILRESLQRIVIKTVESFEKKESSREVQIANGDYCKGYYERVKENNTLAKKIKREVLLTNPQLS